MAILGFCSHVSLSYSSSLKTVSCCVCFIFNMSLILLSLGHLIKAFKVKKNRSVNSIIRVSSRALIVSLSLNVLIFMPPYFPCCVICCPTVQSILKLVQGLAVLYVFLDLVPLGWDPYSKRVPPTLQGWVHLMLFHCPLVGALSCYSVLFGFHEVVKH